MLSVKSFVLSLILFSCAAYAQTGLYMPLNLQDAYELQTRSYDGKPGRNYWQNHSDYSISASIDVPSHSLRGSETIKYFNDSPDTLDEIVIRVYQDINKFGNVHDFPLDIKEPSDGMVITSLKIGGQLIDINDEAQVRNTGTNLVVLKRNVLPHKSITISADWNFVIPKINTIRMGTYDSTSFFIAYWYPQVAVYDDIDGWDKINYTGSVEFYNDFNNYDVNITVPNNMCVWSTGILQNAAGVMGPALLERYTKAMDSPDVVGIISPSDYLKRVALMNISSAENTWHIKADKVCDFTFGLSDHYLWDGCSVKLSDKKVFVSAAYKDEPGTFNEVCETTARTVEYLSKVQPGVSFPFPKITVFDGEGGMESPMMVNQGDSKEHVWMVYVTTHEVAHSYFPFYMGINERRYAWMDEGWAQFLDEPVQWLCDSSIDFRARDIFRFTNLSGQSTEVPPMVQSYQIKDYNAYGNASYFRPDAAYGILKDFLGEEKFLRCLKEYITRWNGKHPGPYDFFFTFNDAAGEDLSWFWEPWFFENGYADLSIDSVAVKSGEANILIKNEGKLPIPVELTLVWQNGTRSTIHRGADVWKDDKDELWIKQPLEGSKLNSISLGSQYIPDMDKENNYWER